MALSPPPEDRPAGALDRYRWHLVALLGLGLVALLGWAARPSPGELLARLEGGSPAQRMRALHALSQRAPELLDGRRIQALLEHPDPRVREIAFTNVVSRHVGKQALLPLAETLGDPGERQRALLWLSRDVASAQRLTRAELEHYFTTFAPARTDPSPPNR